MRKRSILAAWPLIFSIALLLASCADERRSLWIESDDNSMGLRECGFKQQPLSTVQLRAFAGEPDKVVPWRQIEQFLRTDGGYRPELIQKCKEDMRRAYVYARDMAEAFKHREELSKILATMPAPKVITTEMFYPPKAPPSNMSDVEVWLYAWTDPWPQKSFALSWLTVAHYSTYVLVENGHAIICGMLER